MTTEPVLAVGNDSESFLDSTPSQKDIHSRVAFSLDELHYTDEAGLKKLHVCAICDEFMLFKDELKPVNPAQFEHADVQAWLRWDKYVHTNVDAPDAIRDHFSFPNVGDHDFSGLALSPRAKFIEKDPFDRRTVDRVSCCKKCYDAVTRRPDEGSPSITTPPHPIANLNYVGVTPQCLLDLTPIEVCYLSPIKSHGHALTLTGGTMMGLRGTLSMFRMKPRKIARATLQLEALGLCKHIVALAEGNMTHSQHNEAKKKAQIRTEHMHRAIDWLCVHHKKWREEVDAQETRDELANTEPIWIDRSKECPSENENVEQEELFTCYYPDGVNDQNCGGFEKKDNFKEYVEQMAGEGVTVEMKCRLEREFVSDDVGALLDACVLQFPHGVVASKRQECRTTEPGRNTETWMGTCDILQSSLNPCSKNPYFSWLCSIWFVNSEF